MIKLNEEDFWKRYLLLYYYAETEKYDRSRCLKRRPNGGDAIPIAFGERKDCNNNAMRLWKKLGLDKHVNKQLKYEVSRFSHEKTLEALSMIDYEFQEFKGDVTRLVSGDNPFREMMPLENPWCH